jgi:SynChlorMet cassette radical SAM/SPASM protein ScmF
MLEKIITMKNFDIKHRLTTSGNKHLPSTLTGSGRIPLDLPKGVPPLWSFYVYLSDDCNLKCQHCWITPGFVNEGQSPEQVIGVDLLQKGVKEARSLGLINVKLTGGEPMVHPQFLEIVDMLTSEGLSLGMETNGTLLTADIAHHLKEKTNMSFISVSIDGADAETHDQFRGVPGAFENALRGLGFLVDAGYTNTQVIMSVHRNNIGKIEDVVKLAVNQGAGSVKLTPVTNIGRGEVIHKRGEALDMEDHIQLAHKVRENLRKRFNIPILFNIPQALTPLQELWRTRGRTGSCNVLTILGILGRGEIALCGIGRSIPELVYGYLGEDSIREIWLTHPRIRELRRALDDIESYPGICQQCVHAKTCRTGCVALNYVDSRQLVWPSWLCREAEGQGIFPAARSLRGKKEKNIHKIIPLED